MVTKLRNLWSRWQKSSRQNAIDRALYKVGGGRGARDGGAPGTSGGGGSSGSGDQGASAAGGAGVDAGGGL